MSKFTITLSKRTLQSCKIEVEAKDQEATEDQADEIAKKIDSSAEDAPQVEWELEDDSVEVEEVEEGALE